ncbi:MAG: imidazole glycerol phosphate synthase subunit HisH [Kiritimatiellae bacterium]|nr:imidazole glycerol phosphate synthase subunit HisH [Kiritimatiellia bacterium]
MTAILDYRAGNLTSVRNAFAAIGVETTVTRDPAVAAAADKIVFPGVGAAKSAMDNLRATGLDRAVLAAVAAGKPFLGICLGMQVLFERSEEDGGVDCLGVLPGAVRRFPSVPGVKVPEIGWNQVNGGREYYFVHSYYAEKCPYTTGVTEYAGVEFTSAVKKGGLVAYQFHPEKSGRFGLELLKEFAAC